FSSPSNRDCMIAISMIPLRVFFPDPTCPIRFCFFLLSRFLGTLVMSHEYPEIAPLHSSTVPIMRWTGPESVYWFFFFQLHRRRSLFYRMQLLLKGRLYPHAAALLPPVSAHRATHPKSQHGSFSHSSCGPPQPQI